MSDKKRIISVAAFLAFSWSIFFWVSHPRYFKTASEIEKFCMEENPISGTPTQSEYCIGYTDGYSWAFEQKRIDEAMEDFDPIK